MTKRSFTARFLASLAGLVMLVPGMAPAAGQRWVERQPPTSPSARMAMSLAYDSARSRTVLFGGFTSGGVSLGDTWEWTGETWLPRDTNIAPSVRRTAAAAFDSTRGRTVIFGGFGSDYLGDTWEWDGTSWLERTPVTSP